MKLGATARDMARNRQCTQQRTGERRRIVAIGEHACIGDHLVHRTAIDAGDR